MGSTTKSIKYEVLVYPKSSSPVSKEQQHYLSTTTSFSPNDDSSSNHSAHTALFETKVQKFACDRENMQQYWIPEGYHPVLIPRTFFNDNNNFNSHQLRSRINNNNDNINNDSRRRRNNNFNNDGRIAKRRCINRRTILGQSPNINNNTVIYRQNLKETISALRNAAVTISSNSSLKDNNSNNIINNKNSPSIIIGEMWKCEPEKIKKHYERLAIKKKITQALAFEQKISSLNSSYGKSTPQRRYHVNPIRNNNTSTSYRYNVHNNAVGGLDVDCNNIVHQNSDNNSFIISSPSSSSPNIFNDRVRPIPSSDDENENYENYNVIGLNA